MVFQSFVSKMGILWLQLILCLFTLLLEGTSCQYLPINAAIGVETPRVRRQAGYVYDRPSISFNLPSQNIVASTSTQATTVDRTLVQQMYYAYPAPAGGSVSTGYSNAGSTVTSGGTGYNYAGASQNTASGSTGSSTSSITASSGSTGYNYGSNTAAGSGSTSNTASTVNIGSGATGYNYGGTAQNTASGTIGDTNSVSSGGEAGYSYSGAGQNVATGSTGGSASTVTTNSGSSGYSYGSANENTASTQIGGAISTGTSSATSSAGGYNYETQNVGSQGTQTIGNTVSNLYSSPTSGSNTGLSVSNTVSTNAPQYLPPSSGTSSGGSVISTQSVSGQTSAAPSDRYLPPIQNTQSVTVTQAAGNAQSVNTATQISSGPVSTPNSSYLQPSTLQGTSNIQTTQTQTSVQSGGSVQSVPTQDYLPPTVNSGTRTQVSVSRPAATYLPPVF